MHGEDGDVVTRLVRNRRRIETRRYPRNGVHGISFDDRDVENATEIKMQVWTDED